MQRERLGFFSKVHIRSYNEDWAYGVTLKMSEQNGERVSGGGRVQMEGTEQVRA